MRFSQDSALGSGAGGWGAVRLGRMSDDVLTLSTMEPFLNKPGMVLPPLNCFATRTPKLTAAGSVLILFIN